LFDLEQQIPSMDEDDNQGIHGDDDALHMVKFDDSSCKQHPHMVASVFIGFFSVWADDVFYPWRILNRQEEVI
jgi:hypothetical protein